MVFKKGDLVKVIATSQLGIVEDAYYASRFKTKTSTIYVILEVDENGVDTNIIHFDHEDLELVLPSSHEDFYMYCKKMFFFMEEDK